MSLTGARAGEPIDGVSDVVYRMLMAFRRSFLLFTGGVGVVFMIIAAIALKGVNAAILGLFGMTFVGVCIVGLASYWLLRTFKN